MGAPEYIFPPPTTGGTPVGGSGTPGTIPVWSSGTTLTDSPLTVSGTTVTATQAFTVNGTHTFNGNLVSGFNQTWTLNGGFLNIQSGLLYLDKTNSRIGIGTASPGALLDVNTGSAPGSYVTSTRLSQTGTAANSGQRILFYNSQQTWEQGALGSTREGANANFALTFLTSVSGTNAEQMRITSTGNVGIGTASPVASAKLTLGGAANSSIRLSYQTAGTTEVAFDQMNSATGEFRHSSGVSVGWGGFHTFYTDTTEKVRISNTSMDASLVSGYGLKLPATPGNTDSQTLDCYQDGGALNSGGVTWTPTVAVGGSTTGVTYDVQVGRYTRIGNTIIAHGYVKLTSNGTGTGSVTIGGLPTSSNTANVFGSGSIGFYANIATTGQLCLRINPNSTSLTLTQTTPAGGATAITDTQFADTGEILFTVCYPAT